MLQLMETRLPVLLHVQFTSAAVLRSKKEN
jgi:hypothetical protein